jgi:hypothetical protein
MRGSVRVRGSWRSGQDLDLALVTRTGRRICWLSNRSGLSFDNVASASSEHLAVRWLPPGRYRVEVSRASADSIEDAPPTRGTVRISAPGLQRRLVFNLAEGRQRTYLAELRIHRRSRLVPAP